MKKLGYESVMHNVLHDSSGQHDVSVRIEATN